MVGGGQLARMTHAGRASRSAVRCACSAETRDDSAAQVVADVTVGDCRDLDGLRDFAKGCDVVTFDHEHVPTEHLRALEADGVAVRPGRRRARARPGQGVMRERLADARRAVPALGGSVADAADVARVRRRGRLAGRAQDRRAAGTTARASGSSRSPRPRRPSRSRPGVAAARRGAGAASPRAGRAGRPSPARAGRGVAGGRDRPARRRLRRGDRAGARPDRRAAPRRRSSWPCGSPASSASSGVLAVELFETADGRVLVNELAMRPHNCGHWTIDGARTSPVRAAPAGRARPAARRHRAGRAGGRSWPTSSAATPRHVRGLPALMAPRPRRSRCTCTARTCRPGRKVGHVTALGDDLADVRERAPGTPPATCEETIDG